MSHSDYSDPISVELEKTCAEEKIHLLGGVQAYGFLVVIDIVTRRIVQVSSGIVNHWPGLGDVNIMLDAPACDWFEGLKDLDIEAWKALPLSHPMVQSWRPRFDRCCSEIALATAETGECLVHRTGHLVIVEWLPILAASANQKHRSRTYGDIMSAIGQLQHPDKLEMFFDTCVRVVQEFSGYDRVMLYRFLPDGCGEVVAEHTAKGIPERFQGLRFPATDIPSQARALYLANRLRVLVDVEGQPDVLIPEHLPDGSTLDQSHCILRSMATVHLSYLRNMKVRSTLTLSIVHEGKLWGLIACHHHKPNSPPYRVREGMHQICELIAEICNVRIAALVELETIRQRMVLDKLLNQLQQALMNNSDITSVLDNKLSDLLSAFNASNLGFQVGSRIYLAGPGTLTASIQTSLDDVAIRLDKSGTGPTVQMWNDLLVPNHVSLSGLPEAAGLLLAQRQDESFAFCFMTRKEVVQQVRWGGEPVKRIASLLDGHLRLEPRRSFKEWQQLICGQSEPWKQVEADALQSLLQILIEVHKRYVTQSLKLKLLWRDHHDRLTGLFNRQAIENEISRRLKEKEFNGAVILIDVNHFKKVNETYGHIVGDVVLQRLSRRLESLLHGRDFLARLEGDEFLFLFKLHHLNESPATALALRLHEIMDKPFEVNGHFIRLGISIGIAVLPDHGRTVSELLRNVDLALQQAKTLGHSHTIQFDQVLESNELGLYQLEQDLVNAIEKNQLALVYQPKVDLATLRVTGLEVLVRWNHPTLGQIAPSTFIPIAERINQIVEVDRWVMRAAVLAQVKWESAGFPMLPIAINFSMADIRSSNLVKFVSSLLDEFHLPATALEVEVTESVMMREMERTKSVLLALNDLGICTTLDDFGTGFSSLSYLRNLPMQCIKIDQSFIHNMLQDSNAEKLTQAIIAMGSALQMNIVAEGIETREQMHWLINHVCPVGQGYYFSRPVQPELVYQTIKDLERWLLFH